MSKDGRSGANQQILNAQQPSTPVSSGMTGSDPMDAVSIQEQQLEAYAASFSVTSRQRYLDKLKDYQNPNWLGRDIELPSGTRGSSGSSARSFQTEPTGSQRIVRNTHSTNLSPALELDKPDVSLGLDQEIDETFIDDTPFAEIFPSVDRKNDFSRSNKFPRAFHEDLNRIETTNTYQLRSSHSTSWYKPLSSSPPHKETTSPSIDIPNSTRTPVRSRAPSLQSFSSSFVLRPPTSPLARQFIDDDLDFSPVNLASSPIKSNRRHTLPSHGLQSLRSDTHPMTLAQAARQPPSLQRERTFPFQTHSIRRSYTGLPFPTSPSPSTPNFLRSRRSSFASDASPVQASLVGSYEESILRGRMSTTPSKPLDFVAQIGASGRGDCKPKFPAHVSIKFPAVYYNWNLSNGGSVTDEPSPYVGQIDLEHKLSTPATREKVRKRRDVKSEEEDLNESSVKSREARRKEKRRRRSRSPQGSLQSFGGCYRIPQQGQLQIMISDPHKTAVKCFLVPYSLEGMQPGTKTFIRQRSYSAGPKFEKALTSRSLSDSIIDTKTTARNSKPVLRYLIQLNICCPAKDRYYLYKSIHVVFANRVPDDKENLRVETLWPEPRYTPWRPSATESGASSPSITSEYLSSSTPKRSTIQIDANTLDTMDGLSEYPPQKSLSNKHLELFNLSQSGQTSISKDQTALAFRAINPDVYTKLNRGESGYGGRAVTPESGTGLLARRLKGLVGEKQGGDQDDGVVEGMEME